MNPTPVTRIPPRLAADPSSGQLVPEVRNSLEDWLANLSATLGVDPDLAQTLINQASAALGWQESGKPVVANAFIAAVDAICPEDPLEAMLAVQAVTAHCWAMKSFSNAAKGRLPEISERHLKLAFRLMTIFREHVQTLDRHRRGGEQKVRVEYVNVHAGGQAIVGNVKGASNHER